MNTRRCLKIANRIDSLLQAEINHGIDPERMVADALYARDVLLVCKAIGSGELPELARMYRWAASAPPSDSTGNAPQGSTQARASESPSSTRPGAEPERHAARGPGIVPGRNAGRTPNGHPNGDPSRIPSRISGFFSSLFAPSTLPPPATEPPPEVAPVGRARRPGTAR
jgi:hypothetical protein